MIAFKGFAYTFDFMSDIKRWKSTACFFLGIFILVFWKQPLLGMLFEGVALLQLMGGLDIFSTVGFLLRHLPVVGPYFCKLENVRYKETRPFYKSLIRGAYA